MDLTARLVQVLAPITGQGKNGEWRRQSIILETDGMYPKKVCVTVWGDKINIANLKENTLLNVSFDIESREFNGNWFTDLRAWKVEAAQDQSGGEPIAANTPPPPVNFESGKDGDDLPF